ncbi:hypothetical protein NQ315_004508 [Exocentrus adspersus]|uniref:Uncharacterized protein n=1 Tax=Exocentrus adspersus TaxID=1586481 RepID=A0AAV8VP00_9CUCU|nr:hypothetical protein NQ315_004508 [Exocentrus adspersus]
MYQCSNIDYFSKEVYSPDPNDSTLAIPCLVMLFGLIMYISIFKSEIGSKLRPRSHLHPAAFAYAYGYSFLLYVSAIITTKLTGVSCIFLFIYRIQYEWRRKQLEEFKRSESQQQQQQQPQQQQPSTNHYNHFVEPRIFYPCRRHPQAYVNSNSAIHFPPSPAGPKRFYFIKEAFQGSPCSVHMIRSQSNSLKDIPSFYNLPPPPTISYQFTEHFNKNELKNFPIPRDVTTNTVSTTADFVCDEPFDDYSPSLQHEHEFVTFNLDQALPLRAPSMASLTSRNGAGQGFGTLRRTTPV